MVEDRAVGRVDQVGEARRRCRWSRGRWRRGPSSGSARLDRGPGSVRPASRRCRLSLAGPSALPRSGPYWPRTTLPGSQEPVVQMQECRLGKTSMVMSFGDADGARRPASGGVGLRKCRLRAGRGRTRWSRSPAPPVLAAMTSAPAMWSKWECPTRTASAREMSAAVRPTSGAERARGRCRRRA